MPDEASFSNIDQTMLSLMEISDSSVLDPSHAIYVNRDLNLAQIKMVGFDMDYTLATYYRVAFDELQYKLTLHRMVEKLKYPHDILKLEYDQNLVIRGLIVDTIRGNLIKIDSRGHVWRAMYGRKQLSAKEIEETYQYKNIRINGTTFIMLDAIFSIPKAALFCDLVDFFEGRIDRGETAGPLEPDKNSEPDANLKINTLKLFLHVKESIDEIHSDDSLKAIITKNLGKYLNADTDIALTLHKLRSAGKKTFLLTNSLWKFADVVMSFILNGRLAEYSSWRSYFDIIVVGSNKPKFFAERNAFLEVDIGSNDNDKVYEAGNIRDLELKAGCRGEEILYVGDHIYVDIVRSKKEGLWRTCMIIEELSSEIQCTIRWGRHVDELLELDSRRQNIDDKLGQRRALIAHIDAAIMGNESSLLSSSRSEGDNLGPEDEKSRKFSREQIDFLHAQRRLLVRETDRGKRLLRQLDNVALLKQDELERRFHPYFGRIFREHHELSMFGAQVTSYACIYTAKVSDFLLYSPLHIFRAESGLMSHDRMLLMESQVRKHIMHIKDLHSSGMLSSKKAR